MQKDLELEHNELLFLWLKDDKTFKNGFQLNFTNKYKFNFNNNVLTYEDEKTKNNNQKFNFFANNININVIVGENGTGKSTILKYLYSILLKDKNIDYDYLVIFSDGRYLGNLEFEINNKPDFDLLDDFKDKKLKYSLKHYDSEKNFIDFFSYSDLNISPKSINKFVHESVMHRDEHNFNLFKFTPTQVKLRLRNYEELLIKCITSYFESLEKYLLEERFDITQKLIEFINYVANFGDQYIYFIYDEILNNVNKIDEIYIMNYENYESIEEIFEHLRIEYSLAFYHDLIKFINDYNINSESFKTLSFNEDLINCLLVSSKIFDIDYIDKNNRSYKDLSYGEKTAFGLFVNIYEFMLDRAFKTCILLLDEPDISLHPRWQKQFINDIVENFRDKENFLNIIITTHSPILLSDVPSNNITYLNKDDNDVTFIDKKNDLTFGASIYSLLNDSFYMEEGTSGDFAKEKINKLINDLKTKENKLLDKNELLYTINQIGEPYLQYKIKNMFDEKFEEEIKNDEISKLKKERDHLNKRIELLEEDKNVNS
jgi:predicted ATP-binding protein involved in virulence